MVTFRCEGCSVLVTLLPGEFRARSLCAECAEQVALEEEARRPTAPPLVPVLGRRSTRHYVVCHGCSSRTLASPRLRIEVSEPVCVPCGARCEWLDVEEDEPTHVAVEALYS